MTNPKYKAKSYLRSAKNFTKGYSDIEIKVREATSNDPNGPSSTLLEQMASASHHQYLFIDMMTILDRRLNDKGRNWRHVYKSLIVLDYLLLTGSEQVLTYLKDHIYIIKTLLHFQYIDDMGRDHGSCVRQKTKDLLALIEDPEKMLNRRNNPQITDPHSFLAFNEEKYGAGASSPRSGWSRPRQNANSQSVSYSSSREEDTQLQLALEASRQQSFIDAEKRATRQNNHNDDLELQAALKISAAEATMSKKSNGDLIDLFQGPPAASEIHRELSTLSIAPPTLPYYSYPSHVHSYEMGNSWNNQPTSMVTPSHLASDYNLLHHTNHNGSNIQNDLNYSQVNNTMPEDPFAGLSDAVKKSTLDSPDAQVQLKHVSSSSKPMVFGSIPPNSIPTPFEVAATTEGEERKEPKNHYRN